VDDEQVNVFESHSRWTREFAEGLEMLVNADGDPGGEVCEILLDLFRSGEYSGREKDGAFSGQGGIDLEVCVVARPPFFQQGLGFVPVGVALGGQCFADAGLAVADTDGVLSSDGIGELDESTVFFGGYESFVHQSSSK